MNGTFSLLISLLPLPFCLSCPLSFLTRLISSALAVLSYWCCVFTCLCFLDMEAIVWAL